MSNNKALALLVLLSMAAAAAGAAAALPQPTVFAALQVTPEVSDFWQTLSWFPDVAELLGGSFTGTAFAPNNKAWASVAHETRTGGLPLTTDALKAIILYHIAPGKPAFISDLVDDQVFVSALDKKFTAQYSDGVLHLQAIGSAAKVVTPDIAVGADSASVVHVIDTVLLPFKLETGSKPEGSVAATSIDTSTIEGAQAAASSAINAAGDSLNTALGNAQAALGSASGSVQDAASAAANAVQQAAAGAATSGQAAVGAANGAVTGAVGGAATAVTDTAGTMVDGAIGAVPGAVAGVGAPDAADVNALAAGPAAGPAAAPSPSAAPEPVSAPESVPVPVSSAATASCKYVVLAIVALAVMLV